VLTRAPRPPPSQVLLNEKLQRVEGAAQGAVQRFTTSSGAELEADLVFWCTGIAVSTSFLRAKLPEALDEQGRVKVRPPPAAPAPAAAPLACWCTDRRAARARAQVDKHLRVHGHEHIFCLGDASDVAEQKMAFLAGKHGELVARNFRALLKGGAKAKLAAWSPNMGMSAVMVVTLGRGEGVMQVNSMGCTGCLPRMLKSKDVGKMVQMSRDQVLPAKK
jgi:NADH dehydrogenase FAD-containing subunit